MEYFREANGACVYAGRNQERMRRVLLLAMVASVLCMAGASLFLRLGTSREGSGADLDPMVPVVPLLCIPFTILGMLFVRSRISLAGSVRIDYVGGTITSGAPGMGIIGGRRIPTSSVRGVTLAGQGPCMVGLETAEGAVMLLILGERTEAEGVATELAGLLSVPFRSLEGTFRSPGTISV